MPTPIRYYHPINNGDLVFGLKTGQVMFLQHTPHLNHTPLSSDNRTPYTSEFFIDSLAPFSTRITPFKLPSRQDQFFASLRSHPKYRTALDFKEGDAQHNFIEGNLAVKRKSKAALNWAAESGIDIHFMLDNIDMHQIAAKQLGPDGKYVTGSELRWLFRHRHDEALQRVLHWWEGGLPAKSPFDEHKDAWDIYHPKSGRNPLGSVDGPIAARKLNEARLFTQDVL